MQLELAGKRVLITGGARGIGFACAAAFRAEGAEVAICSRSPDTVAAAQGRLPGVQGYPADLTDAEAAAAMVAAVEDGLGPVDILVTCAGAARRTPAPDLTPAHWRAAMDAKFFSYINVIDPLVKRMASRGSGVIVNVIGAGGKTASPIHLPGGSANAALMLATAGLASAYAGQGLRVVGINPGTTETERVAEGLAAEAAQAGGDIAAARERLVARIPMGRPARPEEIAEVAVFLASPRASYVSGAILTMDGVQTATVV